MKKVLLFLVFFAQLAQSQEMPELSDRPGRTSSSSPRRSPRRDSNRNTDLECKKQERKIESLEKKLAEAQEDVDRLTDQLISVEAKRANVQLESGVLSSQGNGMGMNSNMNSLNGLANYSMNTGVNSTYMMMLQQQMLQRQMMQMQYPSSYSGLTSGMGATVGATSSPYGGSISGGAGTNNYLNTGAIGGSR